MPFMKSKGEAERANPFWYIVWKKNAKHVKVWKFYFFFWKNGVSAAIPWGRRWFRPTFEFSSWFDDGCWKPKLGLIYWLGNRPQKDYVPNSKRYFRIFLRVRYRSRKIYEPTKQRGYIRKMSKLELNRD